MRPLPAALFRRRTVWLPTVWGALLLLALAVACLVGIATHAYRWLAIDQPAVGAEGRGARLLVVEGWLNPYELQEAVQVFRAGRYDRIATTGGPSYDWPESSVPVSFADRAASYLVRHGIPAGQVVAVPAPETPVDRTYASAVQVRLWIQRDAAPVTSLDLFTAGAHARRSRMIYRMAFGPTVEIGALTAKPIYDDPDRWWTQSAAAKQVIAETLSTAWTVCCFWPPAPPR